MASEAVSPASAVSPSSTTPRRRHKKNPMSAIRVWDDSGDQALELLVVEHASNEQKIARTTQRMRTLGQGRTP